MLSKEFKISAGRPDSQDYEETPGIDVEEGMENGVVHHLVPGTGRVGPAYFAWAQTVAVTPANHMRVGGAQILENTDSL